MCVSLCTLPGIAVHCLVNGGVFLKCKLDCFRCWKWWCFAGDPHVHTVKLTFLVLLLILSLSYTIWFPHYVIRWHIVYVFVPKCDTSCKAFFCLPRLALHQVMQQISVQDNSRHSCYENIPPKKFPHKIADIYVHTFSIISRIEILELNGDIIFGHLNLICMFPISHFTRRHNGGTARGLRPGRDGATQRDYTPG